MNTWRINEIEKYDGLGAAEEIETDGHSIALVYPNDEDFGTLLLAAPDMLEALKYAAQTLKNATRRFPKSISHRETFNLHNAIATVGSAIYKATEGRVNA